MSDNLEKKFRIRDLLSTKSIVWIIIPILLSIFALRYEAITNKHERIANTYKRYDHFTKHVRIYYYDIIGVKNKGDDPYSIRLNFLHHYKDNLQKELVIKIDPRTLKEFVCNEPKFAGPLNIPGISTALNNLGFENNKNYYMEESIKRLMEYLVFFNQLGHMLKKGEYVDLDLVDILFKNDFGLIASKYFIVLTQTNLDAKISSLQIFYLLAELTRTAKFIAYIEDGMVKCDKTDSAQPLSLQELLKKIYKDYTGVCFLIDRWGDGFH